MDDIRAISKCENVPLSELHHRYIPKVTPLNLYPGKDPMLFSESHHVSLLRLILEHGFNWPMIAEHPYYLERKHRHDIGVTRWNHKKIVNHIKRRWDIFVSLKKNGFSKKLAGDKPIIVLRKPLWETRYAWDSGFLKGPEIWNGAGRCAAAIVLGWKTIPAYWAEDIQAGNGNGSRFLKGVSCNALEVMEADKKKYA